MAAEDPNAIVLGEWLEVQSKFFRLWERRYVELRQDTLTVYRPGALPSEKGKIALVLPCIAVVNIEPAVEADKFALRLQTGERPVNSRLSAPCLAASSDGQGRWPGKHQATLLRGTVCPPCGAAKGGRPASAPDPPVARDRPDRRRAYPVFHGGAC